MHKRSKFREGLFQQSIHSIPYRWGPPYAERSGHCRLSCPRSSCTSPSPGAKSCFLSLSTITASSRNWRASTEGSASSRSTSWTQRLSGFAIRCRPYMEATGCRLRSHGFRWRNGARIKLSQSRAGWIGWSGASWRTPGRHIWILGAAWVLGSSTRGWKTDRTWRIPPTTIWILSKVRRPDRYGCWETNQTTMLSVLRIDDLRCSRSRRCALMIASWWHCRCSVRMEGFSIQRARRGSF